MKGARTETAGRDLAAGVKGGGGGDLVGAGSLFGKTTTLPSLSLETERGSAHLATHRGTLRHTFAPWGACQTESGLPGQ